MQKNKFVAPLVIIVLLVVVIGGLLIANTKSESKKTNVKIGIVTDLTGVASYWGQSTQVGAEMAKADLAKEGYNVELVYEDYQIDPAKALTSAKKLVEVDKVDGLYAEFNPATYSITPYLKSLNDSNLLFVYDAAPTSPLKDLPNAYKSYFNYEVGCEKLAQTYKDQGVKEIGMFKVNMEFGQACQNGVEKVYGSNMASQSYDVGGKDFKTQILKFREANVGAIINVSFEGDTLTTLKAMKESGLNVPYGTVTDSVGTDTKTAYPEKIKDITAFGFQDLPADFSARIGKAAGDKTLSTEYGAAVAYLHITQMAKAISGNNGNIAAISAKMAASPATDLLGFRGFQDRQAGIEMIVGPIK